MMLSKFLRVGSAARLLESTPKFKSIVKRKYGDMLPASQYDDEWPQRLRLGYALRVYWELWPLLIVTCTSLGIGFICTVSSLSYTKVDTVYRTHSRASVSRTMDLRHPTVHKLITVSQIYEPWPEMQHALDKLKDAEYRALTRAQLCP